MKIFSLFLLGLLALGAEEVAYSLALAKYRVPGEPTRAGGPFLSVVQEVSDWSSGARARALTVNRPLPERMR